MGGRKNKIIVIVVIIFIITPLIGIFPLSVTKSLFLQIDGFTTIWFKNVLSDPLWRKSLVSSLIIGTCTASTSIIIVLPAIEFLRKKTSLISKTVRLITVLSFITPLIVLGAALYSFFSFLKITDTWIGIMLSHTALTTPIAFLILSISSNSFFSTHPNIENACQLFGTTEFKFFTRIFLPNMKYGIVATLILCFTISFNESVITQFISGPKTNLLSTKLYEGIRFELNPEVAAVSVILICISTLLIVSIRHIYKKIQ